MSKQHTEQGFTLVELMIATTVFSVVLLLCTFGLISVGRSYYKGVTVTRTQEVARNIMDDITQAIQFSGGSVEPTITPNGNVKGFFVNDRRYSFIENNILEDRSTDHAFVADKPGATCSAGLTVQQINDAVLSNAASSREFLLPNMRVASASISQVGDRLYEVNVKIVSGDDDALENEGTVNARCRNTAVDSQFCAVAELTSVVQKRLE